MVGGPLLSSYAPRLPLVRDVDGRIEVGVLDVGGGRFSRVGELTSTAANPCLASRLYVACRTGSGQVVAWRYTR